MFGSQSESETLTGIMPRLLMDPALQPLAHAYGVGDVVCDPQIPAAHTFLIESGEVRVFQVLGKGNRRLMSIYGPGHWFGYSAVAALPFYMFRSIAATPCKIWKTPAHLVREAMARQPEAMIEVLRSLAVYLQTTAEETSQMANDDCRNRLVHTLVKFSASAAATSDEKGVVLRMTHEQLAQAVGAARETVSLALTELRDLNLLGTGRNRLTFNPKALREFIQEREPSAHAASTGPNTSDNDASQNNSNGG